MNIRVQLLCEDEFSFVYDKHTKVKLVGCTVSTMFSFVRNCHIFPKHLYRTFPSAMYK